MAPPPPAPPPEPRRALIEADDAGGDALDPPPPAGDAESRLFAEGHSAARLEREAAASKIKRRERFPGHFEITLLVALWAAFLGLIGVAIVWLGHFPGLSGWLSESQLDKFQSIVFSSVVTAALTSQLGKRLG